MSVSSVANTTTVFQDSLSDTAPSSFDISWCFSVSFLIRRSSLGLSSVKNRSVFEQLKGTLFNFYFLGDLRQRFSSVVDSVVLSCQVKMDSLWRSDMELH